MSSNRIHTRNLAFNWGGHAATLVVMFFLSPYIVGKLDAVSYGIWSLLTVLTGYMGIFDLGARASVGRHVALYLGKGDEEGVDETIRAGFGFFTLTGGLILIVGVLLGWLFPTLFQSVPQEHYGTVRYLLPLMVVNIWVAAISAIYSSVLAAHDRFDIARGIDLVVLFVRTVATIYALYRGWGLWGLAGAIIIGNVVSVIGNRIYAGKIQSGLRSFPLLYSKKRLKEIFGYGFAAFISTAAVKIIGQSDLVIVGILLSVAEVREYSVGAMLIYYSATFVSIISRTFFPAVQRTVSSGKMEEVKQLLIRQLHVSLCFGLLVYVGFVFYANSFIELWMLQDGFDQHAVALSAGVMTILALSKFPTLYIYPFQSVLAAMGYVRFNAQLAVLEAITNVLFSLFFVLVLNWGLLGVAAGTLAARLIVPSFWTPYYLCRKAMMSGQSFTLLVIMPGCLATGLFSLVCFLQITLWPPVTWSLFGLHIILAIFFWAVIASLLLIPKEMRQQLVASLRNQMMKISVFG